MREAKQGTDPRCGRGCRTRARDSSVLELRGSHGVLELQRGAFEREGLWARRSSTPLDQTGRRRLFADLEGIEGYSKELASWVRRGSGMIPIDRKEHTV